MSRTKKLLAVCLAALLLTTLATPLAAGQIPRIAIIIDSMRSDAKTPWRVLNRLSQRDGMVNPAWGLIHFGDVQVNRAIGIGTRFVCGPDGENV